MFFLITEKKYFEDQNYPKFPENERLPTMNPIKITHNGILKLLLNFSNWSRSFLIGRSQRVVVEGMASSPTRVQSGVPQGTVLGPLFFLVYINDISKGLTEGTKLFADDSLLYRTIRTLEIAQILQFDLNKLQIWSENNKMEFHPGKCQLLSNS